MNQFYDTLFDEVSNILMTCGGDDDFSSYSWWARRCGPILASIESPA